MYGDNWYVVIIVILRLQQTHAWYRTNHYCYINSLFIPSEIQVTLLWCQCYLYRGGVKQESQIESLKDDIVLL